MPADAPIVSAERALAAGIFDDESVGDRGVAFGLGRILDGVSVLVGSR